MRALTTPKLNAVTRSFIDFEPLILSGTQEFNQESQKFIWQVLQAWQVQPVGRDFPRCMLRSLLKLPANERSANRAPEYGRCPVSSGTISSATPVIG